MLLWVVIFGENPFDNVVKAEECILKFPSEISITEVCIYFIYNILLEITQIVWNGVIHTLIVSKVSAPGVPGPALLRPNQGGEKLPPTKAYLAQIGIFQLYFDQEAVLSSFSLLI